MTELQPVSLTRWVTACMLVCAFAAVIFAMDTGTLKGTVRVVGTGSAATQTSAVENATLTLTNTAAADKPLTTTTDENGAFIFGALAAGDYILTIEANGLAKITKPIRIEPGALLEVQIDMNATVSAAVTIRGEEGLLSSSEVVTSNIVRGATLKEQPLRTDNFQNAIPLTPGAVRDGGGNDYIKGARAGASGYTVNGIDVTDGASGTLAFDIPLEAANSVQVDDNPYAASYGRFTGGVTNLQTKGGGDKFKIQAARFFPALHNVFSTKVDSFRPRLTLSGPVVKNKLYFLVSGEFRYSRIFVPSQPSGSDASVQQNENLFAQLDYTINSRNMVKLSGAFSPMTYKHFGMDTFNSAAVTPNLHQRNTLFTVSEQAVFGPQSFLSSQVSYKVFKVNVIPPSNADYNVTPTVNSGSYFAETDRWNRRLQWQEVLYLPHFKLGGEHTPSLGFDLYHTNIIGNFHYRPIDIRRKDGTLAERITFTRSSRLDESHSEADTYFQDRWNLSPRFTLDYGVRFDHDGLIDGDNWSPRLAFMAKPFDSKTTFRAGAGLFYERSQPPEGYFPEIDPDDPTAVFRALPRRVITTYAVDGMTIVDGPRLFKMRVTRPLETPRSFRWSVIVDRNITSKLTARLGYTERRTTHDLLVDRTVGTTTGAYVLSSKGRSDYEEFQSVLTYSSERLGRWTGFYTFSRSHGDLNTTGIMFSDTPAIVVNANEYRRLPFDSPNRFMFYGNMDISRKLGINVSPLVEIRDGFPFSKVNERLEPIGPRNAFHYPMYFSLDIQATKSIKIPKLKDKRARIGLAVLNITNHFNPRDVQNNFTSPNYGKFYNSLGTSIKAKVDLDF